MNSKNIFSIAVTDIFWNYFNLVVDGTQDMARYKEKFLKRFNSWGHILREQCTYWQNMKFYYSNHDKKQFAHDLKILGKYKSCKITRF